MYFARTRAISSAGWGRNRGSAARGMAVTRSADTGKWASKSSRAEAEMVTIRSDAASASRVATPKKSGHAETVWGWRGGDQIIDGQQRGHTGAIGHQVVGAVEDWGLGRTVCGLPQEARDGPLLAQRERQDGRRDNLHMWAGGRRRGDSRRWSQSGSTNQPPFVGGQVGGQCLAQVRIA